MLGLALAGCRARPSGLSPEEGSSADAGDDHVVAAGLVARARAITEGQLPLPARREAIAIAGAIEASGLREGAGARAVVLDSTAAGLFARLWRAEGREEDATKAIKLYRAASRDVDIPGACEAASAGAHLVGEVTADRAAEYRELYRVSRLFGHGPVGDGGVLHCQRSVEDDLAELVAFRPPTGVLAAIDDRLAVEGAIVLDRDAPRSNVGAPRITRVESWPGIEASRVVVELDRPATYRVADEVAAGTTDPRTFIDFDGVEVGLAPPILRSEGIVTGVRSEATTTGSRIWLDLDGHAWRRVFELREPFRVVVDVARRPPGGPGAGPRTVSRVVLDPGHGGSDEGARGSGGLVEKAVVLDVGRRAASALALQGVSVALTRDDDRFVSLEERTARANAFEGDLFVSIHCNASESRARRAIETYVLDVNRDEVAARVAARENATTQSISLELASILGGMRLSTGGTRSKRFAQLLLRASTSALQTAYGDAVGGGVHAAGFYVLVGARMPAVLFEASYISNPIDEKRLGRPEHRQILADAIVNAVRAYREGR